MTYNPIDLTVAVLQTELFVGDTTNQSSAALAELHTALAHLESRIKDRKDSLKAILMERADKSGNEIGDKGAKEIQANGFRITREKKTSSTPDASKLKELLSEHNLPAEAAFDELTVLEVNPSKIGYLVDTGKLPKEEVESLRSTSYSLRVTAPKQVKALLEVVPTHKT